MDQARHLLGASGFFGTVDMVYARGVTAEERVALEELVIEWWNKSVESPAVKALDWKPKPTTRADCYFDEGWTSDDRFETTSLDLASALCAGGDVRPLLHFLVDVELIVPLGSVWVGVEADMEWFGDWAGMDWGFGHYTSPAYVRFGKAPSDKERETLWETVIEVLGYKPEFFEEPWVRENKLSLGIISSDDDETASKLVELLNRLDEIVSVEIAGIGVVLNW